MKTLRAYFVAQALVVSMLLPLGALAAASMPDYKINGPFKSKNLQVFIIHGADTSKYPSIQTLSEAMSAKSIQVFETGNVNELACQNLSDRPVFIQSGDIVKGGRQDRTMQYDLLIPPHSNKVSLSAFCVESGRWQKRGVESDVTFSSAAKSLAGKELKLAAKYQANQGAVWQQVAQHQGMLSAESASAAPSASPTSYELTMENKGVQKSAADYVKELGTLAEKDKDAIGYAFSIDGKLNSADLYASHALFVKLWPKLLESAAVEAVAVKPQATAPRPNTVDEVRGMLNSNEKAKPALKQISPETSQEIRDSAKSVYFETRTQDNNWLHKNYIMK